VTHTHVNYLQCSTDMYVQQVGSQSKVAFIRLLKKVPSLS